MVKQNKVLQHIPKLVGEEQNKFLMHPFTEDEIKLVISQLHFDNALGLDCFPTSFLHKCWHIMGKDVWLVVEESRKEKILLKDLNNTFIALIPKKERVKTFEDYHPISLCNIVYKSFSKEMANRLKIILPNIIAKEQSIFVIGKSILDEVTIV